MPEKISIDELANRRQFFRVYDNAVVDIHKMRPNTSPMEYFEISPEFGLLTEFQILDVETKQLVRSITDKDKLLGQYLKIMNRKLDSLARVIAFSNIEVEKTQDINLSEGGLALSTTDDIAHGSEVAIRLTLLPNRCALILKGQVILNDPKAEKFNLHIAFTTIDEASQQLIARHIMRKQTQDRVEHVE